MNKFNKGKLIGVVAASLSAVSLMGVGFASWIITGNNEASTDQIQITVADIQDKRITISDISKGGSISFDADPNDKRGDIQASSGSNCSLSFTVSYKVTPGSNEVSVGRINAKFELISGHTGNTTDVDALKASITDGVIVAPWDTDKLGTAYETIYTETAPKKEHTNGSKKIDLISTTNTNTSYTTTFSFVWGNSYDNKNPSYKDDDASVAGSLAALKKLKEAESVKIKITLQAFSK